MARYNTTIIIAGAINGTSCKKLYQELGFESLAEWRCAILQEHVSSFSIERLYSIQSSIQNKRKSFSARTTFEQSSFP